MYKIIYNPFIYIICEVEVNVSTYRTNLLSNEVGIYT